MKPTRETYTEIDRAYDHFNALLFGDALPTCIITMQRHKKAYGYFWGDTWTDAKGKRVADEIALNPDLFQKRPVAETLSTLVHEMCHLWQHHEGKTSRNGYHNGEWASKMEDVGLIPSSTGQPGGKRTGQKVSHYIEQGGAFDRVCAELLEEGFSIPWIARTNGDTETAKKKAASKTRYTCPDCGLNAWAKPDVKLMCGECEVGMGEA